MANRTAFDQNFGLMPVETVKVSSDPSMDRKNKMRQLLQTTPTEKWLC